MRRAVRLVVVTSAAAVLLLLGAVSPAAAHDRSEDASNWRSEIVDAPPLDGVAWWVYSGGLDIVLVNRSEATIVVLGYEGEPYLRVGPDGVEVNRSSPATYLNADRYADVAMPGRADATARPDWYRISAEPRAVWHDHRAHWMASEPPARVLADRGLSHLVQAWEIPILVDGARDAVIGELWWIPPESPATWIVLTVLLFLAGAAAAYRLEPARALLVGAAALGLVAGANVIHVADELWARPLPTIDIVAGALHTGLFVVIGVGTAVWVWRARWGRRLVLAFGSATVLLQEGLLQSTVLYVSQVTSVWPVSLVRVLAVASIVQAGVVAGALLRTRSDERPLPGGTFDPQKESRLPAAVR